MGASWTQHATGEELGEPMSIVSPAEIPWFAGNLAELERTVTALRRDGRTISDCGTRLHSTFQGIAQGYTAAEAEDLLATTVPLQQTGARVKDAVTQVATVLDRYVLEARIIGDRLAELRERARQLSSGSWEADDPRTMEASERIRAEVRDVVTAFGRLEEETVRQIDGVLDEESPRVGVMRAGYGDHGYGTGEDSPPNTEENAGDGAQYDYIPWPEEGAFLARHKNTIELAAAESGIDPATLVALLIKEGGGRAEFTGLPFLSGALRSLEGLGTIFGRNQTVGIGQMRPDVAQRLFRDYYGHEISTSDARRVLAWDDTWGIRLAAAELRHIKEELGVTDREAYVIYAAGAQTEATRLWLGGAPRERAPLVYERADGAEKHHQWAEEYWERAGQEDGRDREQRRRQEERELHEGDMQR